MTFRFPPQGLANEKPTKPIKTTDFLERRPSEVWHDETRIYEGKTPVGLPYTLYGCSECFSYQFVGTDGDIFKDFMGEILRRLTEFYQQSKETSRI